MNQSSKRREQVEGDLARDRDVGDALRNEQSRRGVAPGDPVAPERDDRTGNGGVIVKGMATDPPAEDVRRRQSSVGEPG